MNNIELHSTVPLARATLLEGVIYLLRTKTSFSYQLICTVGKEYLFFGETIACVLCEDRLFYDKIGVRFSRR